MTRIDEIKARFEKSWHDGFDLETVEDMTWLIDELDRITAKRDEWKRKCEAAVEDIMGIVQRKMEDCAYCIHDDECEPGEMMCIGFGRKSFEWRGAEQEEA